MTQTPGRSRLVVHLGFDSTGGPQLARLFRLNDLPTLCWDQGNTARDIAWRAASRRPAPTGWGDLALLTELHWHSNALRPPVEAFRALDWFDRRLPDALFLMTTRDVESWLADRMAATDMKRSARMAALHRGVPVSALPDLWHADWQAHLDAARARFAGRANYLEIDVDGIDWPTLKRTLAPHVPALTRAPRADGPILPALAEPQAGRLMALLSDDGPPAPLRHGRADPDLVDRLIAHCLSGMMPAPQGPSVTDGASPLYAWFDGARRVLRRNGRPWPCAISPGDPAQFHAAPANKIDRIEGVVNDLLSLGASRPVQMDMQDGRRLGIPGAPAMSHPLLVYNRRAGAQNLVLWPLPGFHSLGGAEFALPASVDTVAFADKRDHLVWRGSLSGNSRLPDGGISHAARRLLDTAVAPDTPADARDAALALLPTIPRLATLRRFAGRPDMDLGLVLSRDLSAHAGHPLIAPHLRPHLPVRRMLESRYQLCLAGFDVGTNFIWAANSHAVVLKEEAGWEVYFTPAFTPWVHYIPITEGCADLAEKLDWARANPAACMQMSAAARQVVAQLSDRAGQRDMMRAVADALPAVPPPTGQGFPLPRDAG